MSATDLAVLDKPRPDAARTLLVRAVRAGNRVHLSPAH